MTARKDALTVLKNRLAGITTANGYASDAGLQLFIGEAPTLGPDDPHASIAVVVEKATPRFQGENVVVELPVGVQVIVRAATEDPWGTVEDVIGDVKKAVETDHDLGGTLINLGLTRGEEEPLDREDGSEYVGVQVDYRLLYAERWGAP